MGAQKNSKDVPAGKNLQLSNNRHAGQPNGLLNPPKSNDKPTGQQPKPRSTLAPTSSPLFGSRSQTAFSFSTPSTGPQQPALQLPSTPKTGSIFGEAPGAKNPFPPINSKAPDAGTVPSADAYKSPSGLLLFGTGQSPAPTGAGNGSSAPADAGGGKPSKEGDAETVVAGVSTIDSLAQKQDAESTTEPQSKATTAPVPVEVFDLHGDLKLIVGKEKAVFQVCSRALARCSPVWGAMLYGPFAEGKNQQPCGGDWEVQLPDDNPQGLRILCLVVHCMFAAIPRFLTLTTLFHTTVVCDKYDAVGFLKPFWNGWVEKLPHPVPEPSVLSQHLWIAHILGDRRRFTETVWRFLIGSVTAGSSKIYLETFPRYDLYGDVHLQSLGILGKLEQGRRALLREVYARLENAREILGNAENNNCCADCSPEWKQTCNCAILGATIRVLGRHNQLRLWSGKKEDLTKHNSASVRTTVARLNHYRVEIQTESTMNYRQGKAHASCFPWPSLTLSDLSTLQDDLVPLDEEHFKRQAEKSGISKTTSSSEVVLA